MESTVNLHETLYNHFLIQNESTPLNDETSCGAKVAQEYDKTKPDINDQVNLSILFKKSGLDTMSD